jgi:hypothetical protein
MIATSTTPEIPCAPWKTESGDDFRLHEKVIHGLRHSGYGCLSRIKCEVTEGVAVVDGIVPSFYLKQVAQSIILRIDRIKVKNNLIVQYSR